MNNLAKANVQLIMEIMKLTIKEDFHRGIVFLVFLITKSHYLKRNMTLS